ncbi:FAD-dependent oxidoreductase [Methanolobus sp. ZRKC3]|uniref:NAD(P)/FAD-dependent oxidoreductase n=1 Tax=Methanolobus sp. ZRKC3 TaxID=3125786 RepID=UPI0032553C1B
MKKKGSLKKEKLIIVGAGAVGMAVATSVKRHSNYDITVISSDTHTAYSQCGMPFVISGDIEDFNSLILRKADFFKDMGINVKLDCTVDRIDITDHEVHANGEVYHFDKAVIATGSKASIPEKLKEGTALENVFTLRTLNDAIEIDKALEGASNVLIIGGGGVGVELAVATAKRGKDTLLVNRGKSIFSHIMDPDMADIIKEHLESLGIGIITGHAPQSINGKEKVESVSIEGQEIPADLVVISTGVEPQNQLARDAGVEIGITGGIITDSKLHPKMGDSYVSDIYCGGECTQVQNLVTGKPMLSQLASSSRRMAGVIINNLTSTETEFEAIVNPWVALVGELQVGTVGITSKEAKESGMEVVTGIATGTTHAEYYSGSSKLFIKLIFNDRYLVGAQVIAGEGVKERIDGLSLAIKKRTTVDELLTMETAYTPPMSMLVDPLTFAAKGAAKKMRREKA